MRIFNYIKNELFYAGLDKERFDQVKEPVGERNRKSVISWSIITGLFWFACFFIFADPKYDQGMTVVRIAFVISIVTLLSALLLVKRFRWLLLPTMYLLQLSVFGTGIGLAVLQPDQRTATMIAFALMVPLLYIDRTIVSIAFEALTVVFYVVLGRNVIYPEVYSWGLITLVTFSLAGIMSGHVVNKSRFERFVYADSADKLAVIEKNYNAELEKEVAAKTERIVTLHNQFVIGMATMVESRDNSTGGHIKRTSEGVRILIEAIKKDGSMKLTDEFCEKIVKAAPMHDLGKIAVDDGILRKPGRFTPEEFEIMKTHAAAGARIVHEILIGTDDKEFCRIAENVAHYHHERVDGTGYPDKLKGDDIPLEARIMAIADVYDALVSKRVYKESFSFEKADEIILEGMGTQFDPKLKKYYEAARPKLEEYYSADSADSAGV